MTTKAQLAGQLKRAGIPVPKSAKVADMEHRLKHWLAGDGFHLRLLRNPRHANTPVALLTDKSKLYWLPNSKMTQHIIASRIVLVLDRTNKPSNDAIILDVPSDYDSRWGNGSNDSADS
jgi:hypothetical protein|tara:strand:- start:286 stop:642 length:357 start_codon:yes stop_codon:yes gene_type:complete